MIKPIDITDFDSKKKKVWLNDYEFNIKTFWYRTNKTLHFTMKHHGDFSITSRKYSTKELIDKNISKTEFKVSSLIELIRLFVFEYNKTTYI